jgi:hypothetical protein
MYVRVSTPALMQIKSCSGLLAILAGAILVAECDGGRIRLFRAYARFRRLGHTDRSTPAMGPWKIISIEPVLWFHSG